MHSRFPVADPTPAHSVSGEEVLAALASDAGRGLTQAEARARLDRFGANVLTAEKPVPAWRKFLAQFQDVLVILLLIATAISAGCGCTNATRLAV